MMDERKMHDVIYGLPLRSMSLSWYVRRTRTIIEMLRQRQSDQSDVIARYKMHF
jgi:hypothetical protein